MLEEICGTRGSGSRTVTLWEAISAVESTYDVHTVFVIAAACRALTQPTGRCGIKDTYCVSSTRRTDRVPAALQDMGKHVVPRDHDE